MEKNSKIFAAIGPMGIILFLMPTGANPRVSQTIFGSQPWISGLTGKITGLNGTQTQTTLIPSGVVAFKMVLVATYNDTQGGNETIYEQSSLPGLALIQINGRPIRDVTAYGIAAVKLTTPLPSEGQAYFKLNFSSQIHDLNRVKWHYQEISSPLVSDGTLAAIMLPPFSVLPSEVFADHPIVTNQVAR